jgi:hypothetical protein
VKRVPELRKIFRVEETAAARLYGHEADAPEVKAPLRHAELMTEVAGLRAIVAAMAQPSACNGKARNGDTARLTSKLNLIAGAIGGQSVGPRPDDGMTPTASPRNSRKWSTPPSRRRRMCRRPPRRSISWPTI